MGEVKEIMGENQSLNQQLEKSKKEFRDFHSEYTKELLEKQELLHRIKMLAKLYSEN